MQSFILLWFTCLYITGQPASSSGQKRRESLALSEEVFIGAVHGIGELVCQHSAGSACSADQHQKHSTTQQGGSACRQKGAVAGREPLLMHSQS